MTRKDFELIAARIREEIEEHQGTPNIARRFAVVLQRTNDRFDRARFLRACGVDDA